MSYENSPAARLIATTCCICNRDLVDAVSVESGIGPVCREKYGYTESQHEPDWDAYCKAVGDYFAEDGRSPRTLANIITHRIAASITAPTVRRDILALSALGFTKLAETLASRVSGALVIEITTQGPLLSLKTPYDVRLVEALRSVRGRRWDAAAKVNTFPVSSEPELLKALRTVYAADAFVMRNGRVTALGEVPAAPAKPVQTALRWLSRAETMERYGLDQNDGVMGSRR